MLKVLIVGLGGFAGAIARYLVVSWTNASTASPFPWGTLAVNALGCLLIGFVVSLLSARSASPCLMLFLVPGVLGGFTTFSAFGLETIRLLESGRLLLALAYVSASLLLGLLAVFAGMISGKVLS